MPSSLTGWGERPVLAAVSSPTAAQNEASLSPFGHPRAGARRPMALRFWCRSACGSRRLSGVGLLLTGRGMDPRPCGPRMTKRMGSLGGFAPIQIVRLAKTDILGPNLMIVDWINRKIQRNTAGLQPQPMVEDRFTFIDNCASGSAACRPRFQDKDLRSSGN